MQEALSAESGERDELERLRQALTASGDILYEWDLATDRLLWSRGAGASLGIVGLELGSKGESFERRLNPEDIPSRRMALASHMATRERYDCEYRVRTDSGSFHWVHDRGATEFAADGKPLRMSGVLRVITARKETEARLEYLSSYDELTGHYNRARLRDSLEHALAYALRYNVSGGYLAIGIDRLSLLSEAFDFGTVNRIVTEVGSRLDRCLRASDVIGRTGDDSFGVVLTQCETQDMPAAAEKILEIMRASPIETPAGPIHVTVSLGGIIFPDGARTAHDVMAKGEIALQATRQSGRDSYACYHRSEAERLDHRHHVETFEEVQVALRSDRLLFAYQPVVTSTSHEVAYYECLMRMRRESGELVAAAAFIPIVEQLGLIRAIDRKALELAIADLYSHRTVVLAVNVSSITAFDRSWFRLLASLVKGHPEIAERLIVEITETVAVSDVDEMGRFVSALRDLGCKVALDDFGAGYTSFRHLKAVPVDVIKIDGAFVRNVSRNLDNQLFIRTLIGLADGFGLGTVAECVETASDAEHLARHGITYLQGWHFGKPDVAPTWRASSLHEPIPGTQAPLPLIGLRSA
jgi:diguanylate cyclase (GGDEF)-like protein/PAS domain S-box-containing protein